MKHLTKLIFIFIFSSHYGAAQTDKNTERKIDSLFSKYNAQTVGVVVSVVRDGEIILKKGYGMANLEYDIPISPETIFNVGSVSKQFTTFSIYLLEKQGKISLEDDIRKYIPEVPDFGKKITIRHLCFHTSGLKDQWALLTLAGWRMDDVITTEHVLKLVSQQKELNFIPGTQFKYSNTGFTLLAEIVKRASGQTFAEFTKDNIFIPLEMENTQFYDDNEKIVKHRAYSYGKENGVYKKRNLNNATVGPTNLYSTVEDLSKWVVNFEKPIVGDVELIKKFNQIALLDNGEPALYAVRDGENIYHAKGQFFRNHRGLNLYNHTGSDAGFKTYLGRFPDERLSIIVLSNDEDFLSYKIGMDMAEYFLKDKLNKKIKIVETQQNEGKKAISEYNTSLKDFEGEFLSEELSSLYSVRIKEGKLIMSHNRLNDVVLTEVEKDKFSGRIWFSVDVTFKRNKKGKVIALNITNFGATNVNFNKMK
jgi:CubicO group peptidase (beta-lactamase class C family)